MNLAPEPRVIIALFCGSPAGLALRGQICEGPCSSLLQTVPCIEGRRTYGTRQGSAEYVWDGSQEVDRRWGNAPAVGLDAVEQFRVEVNAVSAKFSRPSSIVISTKSGTNQVHGSAFETARNSAIGVARRRQDMWPKAPFLNRHEFGASVGGPVYIPKLYNGKDRTSGFPLMRAPARRSHRPPSIACPQWPCARVTGEAIPPR